MSAFWSRRMLLAAVCGGGASCSRLYYASMEKLGREKRDILVGRIEAARKDQEEAKEQFQDALEAFQSATGFTGGDLEKTYRKLNGELKKTEERASDVRNRIESIEKVANDLFREWEQEIEKIQSAKLKTSSRRLLQDTRRRYQPMITKMRQAERRMEPVIEVFRDQVLYLKHNLNAQAIQSLKNSVIEVDERVAVLIKDIEASIDEADVFIAAMKTE